MFPVVLDICLITVVLLVGVTQVVIPLWTGRPTWPMSRRIAKLEREVTEAREMEDEARVKRLVTKHKRNIKQIRRGE